MKFKYPWVSNKATFFFIDDKSGVLTVPPPLLLFFFFFLSFFERCEIISSTSPRYRDQCSRLTTERTNNLEGDCVATRSPITRLAGYRFLVVRSIIDRPSNLDVADYTRADCVPKQRDRDSIVTRPTYMWDWSTMIRFTIVCDPIGVSNNHICRSFSNKHFSRSFIRDYLDTYSWDIYITSRW